MRRRDGLIVLGLLLAPVTSLRVWKVGPAEALLLLWAILELPALLKLKLNSLQLTFWMGFLASILLGTAFGSIFYASESEPSGVATYVYLMFVALSLYAGLHRRSLSEIEALLTVSAVTSTLFFTVLLGYSEYASPFIGSIPLTYADLRFSGGADNPHQLAVLMGATLFIHSRSFVRAHTLRARLVWFATVVCALTVGVATRSSTWVMAVALTTIFAVLAGLSRRLPDPRGRRLASLWLVALLVFAVAMFSNSVFAGVWRWIESDPNGLGRLSIFASIGESLKKSALFGLGPGVHALGGTVEYHNTYLEILAMSGLVGLMVFVWYAYRQFRLVSFDRTLVLIIAPLYLYGLAGFALRRLPYWIITMMVVVIAEKMREGARHSAQKGIVGHETLQTPGLRPNMVRELSVCRGR